MTKKEFIRLAVDCGYCNKRKAMNYAKGRNEFTDDDFVKVGQEFESAQNAKDKHNAKGKFGYRYMYQLNGATTKHYHNHWR